MAFDLLPFKKKKERGKEGLGEWEALVKKLGHFRSQCGDEILPGKDFHMIKCMYLYQSYIGIHLFSTHTLHISKEKIFSQ